MGQTDRSFSNRFKEHDRSFRFKNKESKLSIESSPPEDGRSYRTKYVELIEVINKLSLLHLVGCLYYCIITIFNETVNLIK